MTICRTSLFSLDWRNSFFINIVRNTKGIFLRVVNFRGWLILVILMKCPRRLRWSNLWGRSHGLWRKELKAISRIWKILRRGWRRISMSLGTVGIIRIKKGRKRKWKRKWEVRVWVWERMVRNRWGENKAISKVRKMARPMEKMHDARCLSDNRRT